MPVAKRGERGGPQAFAVVLAGTLGMIAVFFLITRSSELFPSSEAGSALGAGSTWTFEGAEVAETIADTGPVTFPDLAGRDRDIIVQHDGDDPLTGWSAFGSRPLSADRACSALWQPDEEVFTDSCSDTTWDDQGRSLDDSDDLPSYPVAVDGEGTVSIDLNAAEREAADQDTEEPAE